LQHLRAISPDRSISRTNKYSLFKYIYLDLV
jgi:hypothetical protein